MAEEESELLALLGGDAVLGVVAPHAVVETAAGGETLPLAVVNVLLQDVVGSPDLDALRTLGRVERQVERSLQHMAYDQHMDTHRHTPTHNGGQVTAHLNVGGEGAGNDHVGVLPCLQIKGLGH